MKLSVTRSEIKNTGRGNTDAIPHEIRGTKLLTTIKCNNIQIRKRIMSCSIINENITSHHLSQ